VSHLRDEVEQTLMGLLSSRAAGSSICPSEVARALDGEEGAWRALMPSVRIVAGRLAHQGVIDVTQRGQAVAIGSAIGPVRLRRGPHFVD